MKRPALWSAVVAVVVWQNAIAAEWSWTWTPPPGAKAPEAEIAPFKFDKRWAYAVEIDDNPASALTVVQPLLSRYYFTDTPPGLAGGKRMPGAAGGKRMPFVGGVGVIVASTGGGNNSYLNWEQLRELKRLGWGVLNHSYAHAGRSWGNPPEILSPEQIRHDLFWSQTLIGHELGGRTATHFVYPNGYTPYRDHLAAFGLRTASRVGASPASRILYAANANWKDVDRNYLDEGAWSAQGKGDPEWGLPNATSSGGAITIDFTHSIEADERSKNHQRWKTRLDRIASRWGEQGTDEVWCAPSDEIFEYAAARNAAKLSLQSGKLTLSLPDDLPGASLTVRLSGLSTETTIDAPPQGTLYRKDSDAWLTTPVVGQRGSPLPKPKVRRIHVGPAKVTKLDKPAAIAAVRVLQSGELPANFKLGVDAIGTDGNPTFLVPPTARMLAPRWGYWHVWGPTPVHSAVIAKEIRIPSHASLKELEIWELAE